MMRVWLNICNTAILANQRNKLKHEQHSFLITNQQLKVS
jgi:hypothetical protein